MCPEFISEAMAVSNPTRPVIHHTWSESVPSAVTIFAYTIRTTCFFKLFRAAR